MGYHECMRRAALLILIATIAVATAVACGPEDPTATSQPPATSAPTATSPAQPTEATATAPDARDTPVPTATLVPEPTPTPERSIGADVGDLAPGFTLPSATGSEVDLVSYRSDKSVVLVFYRGSF